MKGLVEFFIGGRHHIMTTLRFLYRGFERLIGLRRNEKTTLFVLLVLQKSSRLMCTVWVLKDFASEN